MHQRIGSIFFLIFTLIGIWCLFTNESHNLYKKTSNDSSLKHLKKPGWRVDQIDRSIPQSTKKGSYPYLANSSISGGLYQALSSFGKRRTDFSLTKKYSPSSQNKSMGRKIQQERSFYAMGDTPYDNYDAYLLSKQLNDLNSNIGGAGFIVHLGDIMRAKYCKYNEYSSVRKILMGSRLTTFIIPGDNDFNDCPDPDKAWEHWTDNFESFDENWGRSLGVSRQNNRAENFAFLYMEVLFIGLNLVGGNVHDKSEWTRRHKDNYDWTSLNLEKYAKKYDAVVLFGHSRRRNNNDDYFDRLFDLIEDEYDDIPFLYLHGDGHAYAERLKFRNFLDLEVDQGKKAPPLKVTISYRRTRRSNKKFSIDRMGGKY